MGKLAQETEQEGRIYIFFLLVNLIIALLKFMETHGLIYQQKISPLTLLHWIRAKLNRLMDSLTLDTHSLDWIKCHELKFALHITNNSFGHIF